MKQLTARQREALRTWGQHDTVHLGIARQLATRGLVRPTQPGAGCRLARCWPLTELGRQMQREIREGWA